MAFRRATLLFCITTIVLGVNFDLNSDGNRTGAPVHQWWTSNAVFLKLHEHTIDCLSKHDGITRWYDASTIDKQTFIEYVMSLTTVVDGNETSTSAAGANETSDLNTDGPSAVAAAEPLSGRAQEVKGNDYHNQIDCVD
nr:hypothetical protein BaRGS_020535 [Batillaria attramentaria]